VEGREEFSDLDEKGYWPPLTSAWNNAMLSNHDEYGLFHAKRY
jgi:hypothetical protein